MKLGVRAGQLTRSGIRKGGTAQRVATKRACNPEEQKDKQAPRRTEAGLGDSRRATGEDLELAGWPREWTRMGERPDRSLSTRACSSRNFCRRDVLRRTGID